jgi:AraC-like DNA-binding protein
MAGRAAMSVAHFSERFKTQTGMSPMAYVIHLRMQRAAALLQWAEASVAEIAARVGYEDAYYFSRLFRSVFGVSPRAYRQHLNAGS